ncbi:AraC family transcriptional regulator [Streptomyces sp. NPDC047928]|uniref:AraC family transcriptional regulator n=1 Tax=unclassified Streptomyces TaxID=2593676 RepID=UPI00371632D7
MLDAVTAEPSGDHALESLARRVGVSARHLTAVPCGDQHHAGAFRGAGTAGSATTLLGHRPAGGVARHAGFGSPETLRRTFQQELGATPGAYRSRFRTSSHSADADADPATGPHRRCCSAASIRSADSLSGKHHAAMRCHGRRDAGTTRPDS